MNHLLITDRFLPHKGGSRIYYYEIARRMHIPVLTSHEQDSKNFDQQQSFQIFRHWGIRPDYTGKFKPSNPVGNILLNYLPPLFWMVVWSMYYAKKLKPEMIHAGGYQFAGMAALVTGKLWKIPFVVYAHGEELLAARGSRYLRYYTNWVFQGADKVIANSEYTRNLLVQQGVPLDKIQIVNPGISEVFFEKLTMPHETLKRYQLEHKKVLLSVGRLTPRKGHLKVLQALPKILLEHPDLCYVIAGTGDEQTVLANYVKKNQLSNHVIFTGSVTEEELRAWYQACDIFVLANRELSHDVEGFGMVFLEAGAAGKPVIGGKTGGAVEAVQDAITGFLVDTEMPDQIAEKIVFLFNSPQQRQEMGMNGRKWAKKFLWTKQIQKLELSLSQVA
ncbi:MAG: glycosyltransferase family 4 protein [SAR324 cluster bacterium]|nr:glycosyltransferase family 4 protein [SAR324 cluster bacterium]